MPHTRSWDEWRASSPAISYLKAGRRYELELRDGQNMSYLQHFAYYQAASGGRDGPCQSYKYQKTTA
ncbi:MAG: hypothetical protein ACOH5I_10295 [Oligoflexus sp.]